MHNESISNTIFSLVHSFKLTMRSELKANELGLNAMYVKCLTYIKRAETCTANDIVNHFARDKAQIARVIKEMIDKQWVQKSANPEDKRSQLLSLTENGNELAELIFATQNKVHNKMRENLNHEELKEFERVTKIMVANLNTLSQRD
ncbi:MAG: MarR family transcriptional regulator [Psychromonas sp.]